MRQGRNIRKREKFFALFQRGKSPRPHSIAETFVGGSDYDSASVSASSVDQLNQGNKLLGIPEPRRLNSGTGAGHRRSTGCLQTQTMDTSSSNMHLGIDTHTALPYIAAKDPQSNPAVPSGVNNPQLVATAGAGVSAQPPPTIQARGPEQSETLPRHSNSATQSVSELSKHPRQGAANTSGSPLSLWDLTFQIADKKLSENNLPWPPFDFTKLNSVSAEANIQGLIQALEYNRGVANKKKWRYTWRGKEVIVAERLEKIIRTVGKYTGVVDVAIQHSPEITSLAWASVRFLLQVRSARLYLDSTCISLFISYRDLFYFDVYLFFLLFLYFSSFILFSCCSCCIFSHFTFFLFPICNLNFLNCCREWFLISS